MRLKRGRTGGRWIGGGASMLLVAVALSGCGANSVDPLQMSIQRTVNPVAAVSFRRLCVDVNDSVDSELTQNIYTSLGDLGFATLSKAAAFGDECRYWLDYTAHTAGLTGYLREFEATVYDRQTEIGRAHYDATSGASRPDRFGSVAAKMHALLEDLLRDVDRGEALSETLTGIGAAD